MRPSFELDEQPRVTPSLTVAPTFPSQKRTKDTSSGPGISPLTMKAQPPRKRRPDVGKRLFPDGME